MTALFLGLIVVSTSVSAQAQDFGSARPDFWTADWERVVDALKHQIVAGLKVIDATEDPPGEDLQREIGRNLAELNLLAQTPCRQDADRCRSELKVLLESIFDQATREAVPQTVGQIEARIQFFDQIAKHVRPYELTTNLAHVKEHWRKGDGRRLARVQMAAIAPPLLALAIYLNEYLNELSLLTRAVLIGGGLLKVAGFVFSERDFFPFTTRFRVHTNAIREPLDSCVRALTRADGPLRLSRDPGPGLSDRRPGGTKRRRPRGGVGVY